MVNARRRSPARPSIQTPTTECVLQRLEQAAERLAGPVRLERAQPETPADARGVLNRALLRGRQGVDAGRQERPQPMRERLCGISTRADMAGDLLREEGVSLRELGD